MIEDKPPLPPGVSELHSAEPMMAPPIPLKPTPRSSASMSLPPAPTKKEHETKDTYRELIETVVFVVVLVLMLKTFLAEAFVIPTGSMADTLLGYHHKVTCQQCGYPNLVNASSEAEPQDGGPTAGGRELRVPKLRVRQSSDAPTTARRQPMNLRKWFLLAALLTLLAGCNERWSSGDRVLVSKEAYDAGVTGPKRYQVVVFKYPLGPVEKNTPKNYIKRLLGLPGELLAIFFGRLYRWTPQPGDAPPFDDSKEPATELFKLPWTHTNDEQTRKWFEDGDDHTDGKERGFEILRKPPAVMMAMRRVVYDNDYQAADLKGKLDRWSPGAKSGWKPDAAAGFTHEGAGLPTASIGCAYQHLLRPEGPVGGAPQVQPSLIIDSLDYNSFQLRDSPHWVGDLMLECNIDVAEPKGEFFLELSRGIYRYQASWNLATGQCTLYRIEKKEGMKEKKEEWAVQTTRVKAAGSYMLRLANIDSRLTVWVDHDLPFGDGKAYDPPDVRSPKERKLPKAVIEARRGPTKENDLEPASIGSKGAKVKISHVRLWRDTYYTTSTEVNPDYRLNGRDALSDPTQWEPIRKAHFATMYVQPGHYLCLGDNSQASSDSRAWGVVPQRLMLGRALVVYFPLERMGPIR